MIDQWSDILTATELEAHYAMTARIDPRFAAQERQFYESRTVTELNALAHQAWLACAPTSYQLARSHAVLAEDRRVGSEG